MSVGVFALWKPKALNMENVEISIEEVHLVDTVYQHHVP